MDYEKCFLQAAADGQEGVVKALLTSPRGPIVNINVRDSPERSPSGDYIDCRTAVILIDYPWMWMKNDDDVPRAYIDVFPSALEIAAFYGRINVVKLLLGLGAEANDRSAPVPLITCGVHTGSMELVSLLVVLCCVVFG